MSIFHAACNVISRAACISAAESAIQFWTVCLSLQQPASHLAVERAFAEHVEGPSRDAEPAHAVMDPAGDEPVLGDQEALALLAEEGLRRKANVLVQDLRVPAKHPEVGVRVLHVGHVADDVHAGGRDRDKEHRGSLVGRRGRVGDGHDDEQVGDRAVRGEPLVPAEDVSAVRLANRARAELRRVGTRGIGLRHRER